MMERQNQSIIEWVLTGWRPPFAIGMWCGTIFTTIIAAVFGE